MMMMVFTLTEFLLFAQKCDKSFTFYNINTHLIFTTALQSQYYYFLHFPNEETETQKGKETCQRSHSHFIFLKPKSS